jgi:hypothetical protein
LELPRLVWILNFKNIFINCARITQLFIRHWLRRSEVWMSRPDLQANCNGWQAIDPTPPPHFWQKNSGGIHIFLNNYESPIYIETRINSFFNSFRRPKEPWTFGRWSLPSWPLFRRVRSSWWHRIRLRYPIRKISVEIILL